MLKMPPTPWLVWLPPTLYRVSTIQEDLRPGTGQHDAEQIISYLSWKRVLVRVWVTTFCLSLAMSFIWSCVRLLFRSQPSCSEPLTKSFEVSKNAAFCQRSKRVLNHLPRWFYLYWSWWWVDLKREVYLWDCDPGGLTPGCIVLASLTSTIWTEFLSLSPKHVMAQILPRLQCKVDIFIDIAPLVHHLVF